MKNVIFLTTNVFYDARLNIWRNVSNNVFYNVETNIRGNTWASDWKMLVMRNNIKKIKPTHSQLQKAFDLL